MDDRNPRNIIRVLIKRFDHNRRSLMAANMAIQGISRMSRDERGHLTAEKIQAELKSIEQQLGNQSDPALVEIDRALGSDQPFENALAKFVAELRW